MAEGEMQLSVKAKRKIVKYAEGADPKTDAPFEIQEEEFTLVGAAAEQLLADMGVNRKEALQLAKEEAKEGAI